MEILFCFSHSFSPWCILTNVFLSFLKSSSLKVFEAEGNPCFQFLFKFYGFLIFPLISPATGNLDFACDNNFTCNLDLTCNQDSTCNQATIPHFLVPSSDLTHNLWLPRTNWTSTDAFFVKILCILFFWDHQSQPEVSAEIWNRTYYKLCWTLSWL